MSRFFLSISRTKIKKNPRNEKKSECLSVQNVYGYICIYIYIYLDFFSFNDCTLPPPLVASTSSAGEQIEGQ